MTDNDDKDEKDKNSEAIQRKSNEFYKNSQTELNGNSVSFYKAGITYPENWDTKIKFTQFNRWCTVPPQLQKLEDGYQKYRYFETKTACIAPSSDDNYNPLVRIGPSQFQNGLYALQPIAAGTKGILTVCGDVKMEIISK